MIQIEAHCIPTKDSENSEKFEGAYITIFVDYLDVNGAFELAKYYIKEENWDLESFEEDYFVVNDREEFEEKDAFLFDDAKKYGYSMIINCYENQ